MAPFLKLQNLRHPRQETHGPFLRRCKHQITRDIREIPTKLKNLNARWVFKANSSPLVLFERRDRLLAATHDEFSNPGGDHMVVRVLPVAPIG